MKEVVGQRKVVMTKWSLIIFSLGAFGYMTLNGYQGTPLPDSFFMNFVLGLGSISGLFTAGNMVEHRAKAMEAATKQHNVVAENENIDINNPPPSYDDAHYRS